MSGGKIAKIKFILSILLFGMCKPLYAESIPLTLGEAEELTLSNAPELEKLEATKEAFSQQAIADGELPDPKLMAGPINVPMNSFSFTQDDMTMIEVGVQQYFPPGDTLSIKSKQTQEKANAEERKGQDQKAMLLRGVRETWLNLYYWTHAAQVVRENQTLYRDLLKAVEAQYSVGKGSQSDVLQVQVELFRLDDQGIQVQQQIDGLKAQLVRYIGKIHEKRSLSKSLPEWPAPPPLEELEACLKHHPLLKVDSANIEVARHELELANEQYKPGIMVDLGYGIRQGQMACCGGRRADMVGGRVTVDLPLLTANRQDKQFEATKQQLTASHLEKDVHYRDLSKELSTQYSLWQRLSQRDSLYEKQLVPEAKQTAKAALLAYQSATTDLAAALRAMSQELTIQLEQLQVKVEGAKARAALFYLEGVAE